MGVARWGWRAASLDRWEGDEALGVSLEEFGGAGPGRQPEIVTWDHDKDQWAAEVDAAR